MVADGQLRAHARNRKAGRLGRQRRRAGHAGVHLDHQHLAVFRVHRELDVAAARLDADLADDRDGGVAHALVLHVGERLRWRHGDRIAGVHPHRVEVLDRADDDHVVESVAHHLELVLLPPDHRAVDEHLPDRAGVQPLAHLGLELGQVVRGAAAGAPQGEGGADDGRVARVLDDGERVVEGTGEAAVGDGEPDAVHRGGELLAVLGHLDRALVGADQFDPVGGQHPLTVQVHGDVEGRLPAHRGEQRVGHLAFDHPLHPFGRQWLDVGPVRQIRVGHDRRRIGVHQDDPVALLLERAHGLGAGIVELAGLPDDDGTRSQDQDRVDVGAPGQCTISRRRSSRIPSGPRCGEPSRGLPTRTPRSRSW